MKKIFIIFTLILIKMHHLYAMDSMIIEKSCEPDYFAFIPKEIKSAIFMYLIEKNKTPEEVYYSLYPLIMTCKEFYKLIPEIIIQYYPSQEDGFIIASKIGAMVWLKENKEYPMYENGNIIDNNKILEKALEQGYVGLTSYALAQSFDINLITKDHVFDFITFQNIFMLKLIAKYMPLKGSFTFSYEAYSPIGWLTKREDDSLLVYAIICLEKWCPTIEFLCSLDKSRIEDAISFMKNRYSRNDFNKNDNLKILLTELAKKIGPHKVKEIQTYLNSLDKPPYFSVHTFARNRQSGNTPEWRC